MSTATDLSRRSFIRILSAGAIGSGVTGCVSTAFSDGWKRDPDRVYRLLVPSAKVPEEFRIPHGFLKFECFDDNLPYVNNRTIRIQRPVDLLDLGLKFYNHKYSDFIGGPRLESDPTSAGGLGLIVALFPAQHISEGYLQFSDAVNPLYGVNLDTPVQSRYCGGSQLVFEIPTRGVDYDLNHLFHWRELRQVLDPNAYTDQSAVPGSTPQFVSRIELPWGVYLSSNEHSHWSGDFEAKKISVGEGPASRRTEWIELWSADLVGEKPNEGDLALAQPAARMIGINLCEPFAAAAPAIGRFGYGTIPSPSDREQLSAQLAYFRQKMISVRWMQLSSIGASADFDVSWQPKELENTNFYINKWSQKVSGGRDVDVTVSYLGYCLPFGFPMSWVKERRRELDDAQLNTVASMAILREIYYCECPMADPVLEYPEGSAPMLQWTQMPFSKVDLRDKRSALLDPPPCCGYGWMFLEGTTPENSGQSVQNKGNVFRWRHRAYDRTSAHEKVDFDHALFWIRNDLFNKGNEQYLHEALQAFIAETGAGCLRTSFVNQQKYSFVPDDPQERNQVIGGSSRDHRIEVNAHCFGVITNDLLATTDRWPDPAGGSSVTIPSFKPTGKDWNQKPSGWCIASYTRTYPALQKASVRLQQTAPFDQGGATGLSGVPNSPSFDPCWKEWPTLSYHNDYVSFGLYGDARKSNPASLYACIRQCQINFAGDKGGGLVNPGFDVQALSIDHGAVGGGLVNWDTTHARAKDGLPQISAGFQPSAFFGAPELSNLLGEVIGLGDIVKEYNDIKNAMGRIPKLVADQLSNIVGLDPNVLKSLDDVTNGLKAATDAWNRFKTGDKDLLSNFITASIASAANAWVAENQWPGNKSTLFDPKKPPKTISELSSKIEDFCISYLETVVTDNEKFVQQFQLQLTQELFDAFSAVQAPVALKQCIILVSESEYTLAIIRSAWSGDSSPIFDVLVDQLTKGNPVYENIVSRVESAEDYLANARSQLVQKADTIKASFDAVFDGYKSYAQAIAHISAVGSASGVGENVVSRFRQIADPLRLLARLRPAFCTVSQHLLDLESLGIPSVQEFGKLLDAFDQVKDSKDPITLREHLPALIEALQAFASGTNPDASTIGEALMDSFDGIRAALGDTLRDVPHKILEAYVAWRCDIDSDLAACLADPQSRPLLEAFSKEFPLPYGAIGPASMPDWLEPRIVNSIGSFSASLEATLGELTKHISQIAGPLVSSLAGLMQQFGNAASGIIQVLKELEQQLDKIPKDLSLSYEWSPSLQSAKAFEANYQGAAAILDVKVSVKESLSGLAPGAKPAPPIVNLSVILQNFRLHLIPEVPCLVVGFKKVSVISVNGAAPKIDVALGKVEFGQALQFLSDFASILNPSSGPFLEIQPTGIRTGFRIPIPSLTLGALNISNLRILAAVQLRFDGGPTRIEAAVSEFDRPFAITSEMLGGMGYFGLTALPSGIETLEGSLEFGGAAAIDLAITKVEGLIGAGIFHSVARHETVMQGFVNASGTVPLGIATVAVDFLEGISYVQRDGESYATGEVIVTISIHVCITTIDFHLRFAKEFAGLVWGRGN